MSLMDALIDAQFTKKDGKTVFQPSRIMSRQGYIVSAEQEAQLKILVRQVTWFVIAFLSIVIILIPLFIPFFFYSLVGYRCLTALEILLPIGAIYFYFKLQMILVHSEKVPRSS